jgi:hypothetical protein
MVTIGNTLNTVKCIVTTLVAMKMAATKVRTSDWQDKTVSIEVWAAVLELYFELYNCLDILPNFCSISG